MKEKTLLLSSGKCSWGKCYACGWGQLSADLDIDRLMKVVERASLRGIGRVKVFASGSFLDNKQFPASFRKWFAEHIKKSGVGELIIESRPENITERALEDFKGIKLTVAIGLESASDEVLKKYEKGFTSKDFVRAAELLHSNGFGVRTYLMVNMPFSTQQDFDGSVEFALKYSDSVVLINTFPHSKARLYDLWLKGEWKPYDKQQFADAVKKWEGKPKVETDFQNYMFIPKFRDNPLLKGVGREFVDHPYYNVWQDYFARFYEVPKGKDIVLFLPCSFKKPYIKSETHLAINRVIRGSPLFPRIHKVVISSPGVIPMEFSRYYPFVAYDWPEWEETPETRQVYEDVTKKRAEEYLKAHKYKTYLCYFKYDAETYKALKGACDGLGITLTNLFDKSVYEKIKEKKNPVAQPEALDSLKKNLEKLGD